MSLHLNAQTLATYFYNALNKAASIKPLWNMFALAKVSMWNQKVFIMTFYEILCKHCKCHHYALTADQAL